MLKRKGFMHTIEGIFAVMLLLSYATQLFALPEIRQSWEKNSMNQQAQELASVISKTEIKELVVRGDGDSVESILGEASEGRISFSLRTKIFRNKP